MRLTSDGAWLVGVRRVPSPNCDERPTGDVSLIVVHGISLPPGEFGGPWIDDLFMNRLDATRHPYFAGIEGLRVSSHLLVRRDGELVQYVPFTRRAWHAGPSCYRGRERCNDYAIGIELEGEDDRSYADVQYRRLAELIVTLRGYFPGIASDAIVGHSDIAPGRKTDPGPAFDWQRLKTLLA
jgi:AmpD protein